MTALTRRAAVRLSLAGMAMLTGCLNDPVQGDKTIDGRYVVSSVNGAALPAVISEGGGTKVELLRESLTLFQGGTFVDSTFTRTTPSGGGGTLLAEAVESGSFGAGLGTSVVFTGYFSTSTRQRTMLYTANALTYTEAGVTRVYRK